MPDKIDSNYTINAREHVQASGADDPLPDPKKIKDYYMAVFIALLEAMQARHQTVKAMAAEIEINATEQNDLNTKEAAIKVSVPPVGAQRPTLDRYATINQERTAAREDITNSLITTRYVGQREMTMASTNVNVLQTDASEDSTWLETLQSISQVILGK